MIIKNLILSSVLTFSAAAGVFYPENQSPSKAENLSNFRAIETPTGVLLAWQNKEDKFPQVILRSEIKDGKILGYKPFVVVSPLVRAYEDSQNAPSDPSFTMDINRGATNELKIKISKGAKFKLAYTKVTEGEPFEFTVENPLGQEYITVMDIRADQSGNYVLEPIVTNYHYVIVLAWFRTGFNVPNNGVYVVGPGTRLPNYQALENLNLTR